MPLSLGFWTCFPLRIFPPARPSHHPRYFLDLTLAIRTPVSSQSPIFPADSLGPRRQPHVDATQHYPRGDPPLSSRPLTPFPPSLPLFLYLNSLSNTTAYTLKPLHPLLAWRIHRTQSLHPLLAWRIHRTPVGSNSLPALRALLCHGACLEKNAQTC